MNVDATLEAGTQLAKGSQPGMSALDHPAMASEAVIALDAPTSDTVFNAATLEVRTASGEVVALVRMQLGGPAARPAWLASDRRQGIDQLFEDHRIVAIGPGHAEHQWDALAVRDEMAFASEFPSVRRIGPCVRTPRGLGTLAPSIQTRLKSSLSALRSSVSSTRCRPCHTPALRQSRSRRQQVMPLPKPNSCGRCSQGIPVRSTKRMPLKACSLLSRGLPPFGEGATCGNNGSIFLYSAALTSLLVVFPMKTKTLDVRFTMTCFC